MTHYQELMLVDAAPDDVFRLVVDVESWQHLLPHVRIVQPAQPGRWRVTLVWRWVPFVVTMSCRVDSARRLVEYRFGHRVGTRVVVRVAVDNGGQDTASLRLEAEVVRVVPLLRPLVAASVRELLQATLDMVRLLAEADRIAHRAAGD